MDDEFRPCRWGQHDDGSYYLAFEDFDPTEATFEEMGQEGGGYGWHNVVDALIRTKAPQIAESLDYDPEASMFVVVSDDLDVLRTVAGLIRHAIRDPALLKEAIANADPELMD